VVLVHGAGIWPFEAVNLAAEESLDSRDSMPHGDYTRKNDDLPDKRQGAELAPRPSPIILIMLTKLSA
jgi:hypothetical protein